ncbi:LPS O-antigen chain length determinant protein WzzB [Vibrio chagasii]|uniref:LPS O-antigen chain length determinant protein WzzB n=1 Tax=Vibrio chagasii TaxID=170679 RepID=UPI0040698FF1
MNQQAQPYPLSPESLPTFLSTNDDINLKELLQVLWGGRIAIALITLFFMVSGIAFSLLAQEWWSSNAKITKPQPQDISEYQLQVKQFQPVFDVYQEDGTVLVSRELDSLVASRTLFQRFVNTFNSTNNKRAFLDNSPEFQQLKRDMSDVEGLSEDAVRKLYAEWFDKITASVVDQTDPNSPYVVTFQTMTKKSSFDLLTSYILVTEQKVHQDAFNNLQAVVNGKRNELIQQKKILEAQAKAQLLVETERAKFAMDIAQAAGVDTPIQTGNRGEIFDIDLGAKGLKAKVKALESVKNLSVIEPSLQLVSAKLDMLDKLELDRSIEFQTFRYLENVEQPITKDKPKRALIIVIVTLLGGMLGIVMVLTRFAFKK